MKIILHVGVHCTDNDQIIQCLAQNRTRLLDEKIVVPEPNRFRPVIRDTLKMLEQEAANADTQELLLDSIIDEDDVERVILSNDSFFGFPIQSIGNGIYYPRLNGLLPRLRNLFAREEVELFMALRNPATFLPDVFARANETDFSRFIAGTDPMGLRWSALIDRMRLIIPDVPLTIWANEDTPFTWTRILEAMVQSRDPEPLTGRFDFLAQIIGNGGVNRMENYLKNHPPKTQAQYERVLTAFLEKFASSEIVEENIDLPQWDQDYVDELTRLYNADLDVVAARTDIRFITP